MFRTVKIRLERTADLVQTVIVFDQACQRVLDWGYRNKECKAMVIETYHSSQTCSKCGHLSRSSRKGWQFRCVRCGFSLDADLNASRNIATFSRRVGGRLHVSEPNAAGDEAEGRKAVEAESNCKPTRLFVGG